MTVRVEKTPPASAPQSPEVVDCTAADVRRGDQVAFVSADPGGDVAGRITAIRMSRDGSTVALVVGNAVHFIASRHAVIVIRFRTATGGWTASQGLGGARQTP